jgi:hypothetical protein
MLVRLVVTVVPEVVMLVRLVVMVVSEVASLTVLYVMVVVVDILRIVHESVPSYVSNIYASGSLQYRQPKPSDSQL